MTNGFGLKMDFDNFEESHIKGRVALRRKVVLRKQRRGVGEIVLGKQKEDSFSNSHLYYLKMVEFKHI